MSDDVDVPSLEREADSLLERGSGFGRNIRFNNRQVIFYFPCYGTIGLPSPLVFYEVVEIVMRFSDTDLSLLIRLCVIEVKSEGSRYRE